jgi:hypothetical protein
MVAAIRAQKLLILWGAVVGILAWVGPYPAIALALLMPALWAAAESRWVAGLVVLGYQLGATRGLPGGVMTFYGTFLALGVLLWVVAALVVAATWAWSWKPTKAARPWWMPFPLILTALPPIGVLGWVHPINAAGALFPGWGWLGIAGTVFVAMGLALVPKGWLAISPLLLVLWAGVAERPAKSLPGWQGLDTKEPFGHGEVDSGRDLMRAMTLPKLAAATPGRVIVLPESIGGLWFEVPEAFWKEGLASSGDKTVLLGAEIGEGDGRSENILLSVNRTGSKIIYRQRMPVPLTMWRPWASDGTHAYWFENPVVDVAGERAAVLICYEQVIVWPILFSMAARPTVVVAIANDWWAGASTIPRIQENCVLSWCRLFGTPLVTATNT